MKQMLNENDIEQVVGGTVVVSADKMKIGFTTTSFRQIRNRERIVEIGHIPCAR